MVNQIQHYAWGTKGDTAFIPHLLGIEAQENLPYAELWMGAHPKAPSALILDGARASLRQLIAQHPRPLLGTDVSTRFEGTLPFLFKVLSIGEALSIQAHPNKHQAERLHAQDPEHYPDGNHKPEVAVALTDLTALVGFKPLPEILETLRQYPEITNFIGPEIVDSAKHADLASKSGRRQCLETLYATLIRRSITHKQNLTYHLNQLYKQLHASPHVSEQEQLFLTLRQRYPGPDVGLFSIFFLNLVHLKKGQGIFTPAGIPHAYLEGNIVECMANSDNVVRVGLTPKYKDATTLLQILTYEATGVPILEGTPLDVADGVEEVVYATPASEFQLSRLRMAAGQTRRSLGRGREKGEVRSGKGVSSRTPLAYHSERADKVHPSEKSSSTTPKILLATKGKARLSWETAPSQDAPHGECELETGHSVFIPASLPTYTLKAESQVEVFIAGVP
jgi:mannose-6-phosphate isomerase